MTGTTCGVRAVMESRARMSGSGVITLHSCVGFYRLGRRIGRGSGGCLGHCSQSPLIRCCDLWLCCVRSGGKSVDEDGGIGGNPRSTVICDDPFSLFNYLQVMPRQADPTPIDQLND